MYTRYAPGLEVLPPATCVRFLIGSHHAGHRPYITIYHDLDAQPGGELHPAAEFWLRAIAEL